MTVTAALKYATARIVILVEATCGIWFRNWIVDGTFTNTYKVTTAREITSVRWNLTTLLTARTTVALVDANAGSFYWDGATLWVRPPAATDIFANVVQGVASFYWANSPKILSNRFYDPRLLSAPGLSQRIEPIFGGIVQIGGGNLTLTNADGYFNTMQDYQWDAGSVVLKVGVDVYGEDMAIADYQTFATWTPEFWSRTESEFSLRLTEVRDALKTKIPFTFYTRAAYPNIEDETVGKAIPIAYGRIYGANPRLIDPGLKKFKLCGHAIKELSGVRIQQEREQFNSRVVTVGSWLLYSGTTYRYYLASEEIRNVLFNTASLTKQNSVADCVATAGSWTSQENYVYVNPSSGQTISSGTYTVESAQSVTGWQTTNFATKDLANGEFTMGSDWTVGTALSVDFIGKVDGSGVLIANSIDIIQDLLATVGQTNLATATFTTSRARLKVGTDESGNEVFIRNVGVYLAEANEVQETLVKILRCIEAFLYTSATGQTSIGVFEPTVGENLVQLDDTHELDWYEDTDNQKNASKVNTTWAPRIQDNYVQLYQRESLASQYIHNQANAVVNEDKDDVLTDENDVIPFASRLLNLGLAPLKIYKLTVAWIGITYKPGDQFRLNLSRRGVLGVFELLEVKIDLAAKTCQLTLGKLRNLGDSAGAWVDSSATLPSYLSTLTGYGAGSLVWNSSWHADIKTWAKQNVGYWTDANGFANSSDPDSFINSTWI